MARILLLGCLLWPGLAVANGRFPSAMSVAIEPGNADHMLVGTTFGAILTSDGGETWRWLCEDAMRYSGIWDPIFVIEAESGVLAASMPDGLRVSEDGGCTWETRGDAWVSDVDVRDDGTWVIATATGGEPNGLFLSSDRGVTWEPTDLASDVAFYRTIVLGAEDRAWVVEYMHEPFLSTVFVSDDGAESWRASAFPSEESPDLRLVGADLATRDVLWDRADISAIGEPPEWVLRRGDGATGVRDEVLPESIDAFAISEDGRMVLVGNVDPHVWRSTDGGDAFEDSVMQIRAQSFTREGDVVYACADNWEDGFAVGKTPDWGDTWEGLMRFGDISGVVECPPGTPAHDLCQPLFQGLCEQLGLNAPECRSPPDDDAGTDGGPPKKHVGGCDCSSTAVSVWGGLFALVLAGRVISGRATRASVRAGAAARGRPPGSPGRDPEAS